MALSEADTRAKLIDPAVHARGWAAAIGLTAALIFASSICVIDSRRGR